MGFILVHLKLLLLTTRQKDKIMFSDDSNGFKYWSTLVALILFDVFFMGTNIIFSLINSSEIFLLLGGICLLAVIVGVNVLGFKYIVSQFDIDENPTGEKE